MKKVLLIVAIILSGFQFSNAQCIPDTSITHNVDGIYPDSATGLPHAVALIPYSTVIQLKVLADTVVSGFTVPVDDITVDSVSGLPPGFSYTCTPSSCVLPGGSDACILLQGPAFTNAEVGNVYPFTVYSTGHATLFGAPVTAPINIDYYNITVDPNTTGILSPGSRKFEVGQNTPNPFSSTTEIFYNLPQNGNVLIKMYDMLGNVVMNKNTEGKSGINKFSVLANSFAPGIYMYSVTFGKNTITRRMIISNNE